MKTLPALLLLCTVLLTGCTGSGTARKAETARDTGTVNAYLEHRAADILFIDGRRTAGTLIHIGETEITWTSMSGGSPRSRPLREVRRVSINTRGTATMSGLGLGFVGGLVTGGVIVTGLSISSGPTPEPAPAPDNSSFGKSLLVAATAVAGTVLGGLLGLARERESHRMILYERPR